MGDHGPTRPFTHLPTAVWRAGPSASPGYGQLLKTHSGLRAGWGPGGQSGQDPNASSWPPPSHPAPARPSLEVTGSRQLCCWTLPPAPRAPGDLHPQERSRCPPALWVVPPGLLPGCSCPFAPRGGSRSAQPGLGSGPACPPHLPPALPAAHCPLPAALPTWPGRIPSPGGADPGCLGAESRPLGRLGWSRGSAVGPAPDPTLDGPCPLAVCARTREPAWPRAEGAAAGAASALPQAPVHMFLKEEVDVHAVRPERPPGAEISPLRGAVLGAVSSSPARPRLTGLSPSVVVPPTP